MDFSKRRVLFLLNPRLFFLSDPYPPHFSPSPSRPAPPPLSPSSPPRRPEHRNPSLTSAAVFPSPSLLGRDLTFPLLSSTEPLPSPFLFLRPTPYPSINTPIPFSFFSRRPYLSLPSSPPPQSSSTRHAYYPTRPASTALQSLTRPSPAYGSLRRAPLQDEFRAPAA